MVYTLTLFIYLIHPRNIFLKMERNICISILILVVNSFPHFPQRRLNVDCYNISPDLNFILLYECKHEESNGTKYYVYEIFSTTFYALTPNDSEEVELQKILWSPASYDSSNLVNINNNNNRQKKVLPSSKSKVKTVEKSKISQAIAFIHDYDIYYKPKIHSDLVIRVTTNGEYQ